MSQSVIPQTAEERQATEAKAAADAQKEAEKNPPKPLDDLHTLHGDTTITDTVVAKIAGIAARQVPGVHAMGNAARRAISGITSRVTGNTGQGNVSNGVSVEKGESQATVEIAVVVEYGVSIVEVSNQIREGVIQAVEYGTGLEVVSVDVSVTDVYLPEDDDDTSSSSSSSSTDLK